MTEQHNIEFKQSWHDDYLKWVCGFANAVGGSIYIGKDDVGKVVHLENYASLLEMIPHKIHDLLGIICDVHLLDEDGKKYIQIKVNPYSVPVSLRGRYYYRSGSNKVELTGVQLNEFLLKKAGKTWDDIIEERASMDDISEVSIKKYISDASKGDRLPIIEGLTTFEILEKLRLVENGKLKRGAIILFGKDPNRFYPNIRVKIGRFVNDDTDLRFQDVIEDNIIDILDNTIKTLGYKYLVKEIEFRGMLRIENGEYPLAAIREMLLNAVIHRTYMGAPIQLRVYNDKISIWNEGKLPIELNSDDLRRTHSSRPRNPLIADVCFKGGYIDSWGRGTLKIINACLDANLPEPEIFERDGGVVVTLYKVAVGGVIGGQTGGQTGGRTSGQTSDFDPLALLTEKQKEIFELIATNQKITRKQISEKLNINESAIQKHIEILKKKQLIKRIGTTHGYWKIKQ